jgi:DNA-binding transcriptional LysR family regulator
MWGPIPSLLEEFQTKFPRVTWTMHELGPNVQYEALRAKQIDVGFWREPKLNEDDLRSTTTCARNCASARTCAWPSTNTIRWPSRKRSN